MKRLAMLASLFMFGCQATAPVEPAIPEPVEAPTPVVEVKEPWKLEGSLSPVKEVNWYELSDDTIQKAYDENKIVILFVYDERDEKSSSMLYAMRAYTFWDQKVVEVINEHYMLVGVDVSSPDWKNLPGSLEVFFCQNAVHGMIDLNAKKGPTELTWPITMFYLPRTGHMFPTGFHGFIMGDEFVELLTQLRDNAELTGHKK